MKHLTLELEETTLRSLSQLADRKAESVNDLVKQAINYYLENEREWGEDDVRFLDCLNNGGIDNHTAIEWIEALGQGEHQPCPR